MKYLTIHKHIALEVHMLTIILVVLAVLSCTVGGIAIFSGFLKAPKKVGRERAEKPISSKELIALGRKPEVEPPSVPFRSRVRRAGTVTDMVVGKKLLLRTGVSYHDVKFISRDDKKATVRRCAHHMRDDAIREVPYNMLFVAD